MSESVDRVQEELKSLGYQPFVFDRAQGKVVAFRYKIEVGSHKGEKVTVGVSFQDGEEGYPEYPPHWIHVTPRVEDGKPIGEEYTDSDGNEWIAMSRPPGEVWDRLPTKHMGAYIREHLRRIWKDV